MSNLLKMISRVISPGMIRSEPFGENLFDRTFWNKHLKRSSRVILQNELPEPTSKFPERSSQSSLLRERPKVILKMILFRMILQVILRMILEIQKRVPLS